MDRIISYTLKVWLTAIVIGLIASICAFSIYNPGNRMDIEGFFFSLFLGTIFGLMFSSPSIIAFTYLTFKLAKSDSSYKTKKLTLYSLSAILGFLPIAIAYISQQVTAITLNYVPICVISLLACINFYKFPGKTNNNDRLFRADN